MSPPTPPRIVLERLYQDNGPSVPQTLKLKVPHTAEKKILNYASSLSQRLLLAFQPLKLGHRRRARVTGAS